MGWQEWLYPASVLLAAYAVMGITGFGSALVAVPLLAWIWPLPEVVALVILLDVPASMLHGGLNFRQVRWRAIGAILPGMAVGALIGLWLMGQLDKRWPLFLLGLYITWVGWRTLRHGQQAARALPGWTHHAGSGLVGVLEVMFATAGPMVIALLFGAGQIDRAHTFERWLVALPIAFMGVVLGNRLARHIPPPAMRRAMAVLLIASGLSLTQHLWR